MAQTTNYGLKQWGSWERVTRGEVNEIVAQVDEILGEKATVIVGGYTGNGSETRQIVLGFQPRAVLVRCNKDPNSSGTVYSGLATTSRPVYAPAFPDSPALAVTATGFQVYALESERRYTNLSGQVYSYLAFP